MMSVHAETKDKTPKRAVELKDTPKGFKVKRVPMYKYLKDHFTLNLLTKPLPPLHPKPVPKSTKF